jgi:hypothetical protein
MSNPDVREIYTSLETISGGGKKILFIFIFLGTKLFKHYFNNNIDFKVLFGTNKKTGLGYTND